jgi:hypothetical protein
VAARLCTSFPYLLRCFHCCENVSPCDNSWTQHSRTQGIKTGNPWSIHSLQESMDSTQITRMFSQFCAFKFECRVKPQGGGIPKKRGLGWGGNQVQPHILGISTIWPTHPTILKAQGYQETKHLKITRYMRGGLFHLLNSGRESYTYSWV